VVTDGKDKKKKQKDEEELDDIEEEEEEEVRLINMNIYRIKPKKNLQIKKMFSLFFF